MTSTQIAIFLFWTLYFYVFDSLSVDISTDIEKVITSLTRDYGKRLLRRRRREFTTFFYVRGYIYS